MPLGYKKFGTPLDANFVEVTAEDILLTPLGYCFFGLLDITKTPNFCQI